MSLIFLSFLCSSKHNRSVFIINSPPSFKVHFFSRGFSLGLNFFPPSFFLRQTVCIAYSPSYLKPHFFPVELVFGVKIPFFPKFLEAQPATVHHSLANLLQCTLFPGNLVWRVKFPLFPLFLKAQRGSVHYLLVFLALSTYFPGNLVLVSILFTSVLS